MNEMDDYPDLYLKIDVLLLTAVFEKFISAFLEYYRLNPCHYFSSRGLSWNAMLKITGVKVELVSDDCFIPWKRTKEVISYIAKRFKHYNIRLDLKGIVFRKKTNNSNGINNDKNSLYSNNDND